jgi:hypothetical protein
MAEPDVFVNEDSGETLTLAEHLARQREIEREITRMDVAIETHKNALKAVKGDRDKAFSDLRATVREIKLLGVEIARPRSRRRGAK